MLARPPISTLFPTRRSSDLEDEASEAKPDVRPAPGPAPGPVAGPSPIVEVVGDAHEGVAAARQLLAAATTDRKSTRLNSSHSQISYAVFCLKKKNKVSSTRT